MAGGELGWGNTAAAAVGSDLVVMPAPVGDYFPCLRQRCEPVFVEALVAELAVEAFDVSVLGRCARLDQDVFEAVPLRPGNEGAAGELRAIVGA